MEQANRTPSPSLVEQYRRQMMILYEQQAQPKSEETDWLDSRFPEPNIARDRADIPLEDAPSEDPPPPIAETPFVGYLRVFVFTGEGAEPLSDVLVTVSREEMVYANTVTDQDGYTQVIPLPSVSPELSLTPGVTEPFIPYDIHVVADGFRPVRHSHVPVYGNTYVTQPVALLPVIPGTDPEQEQDFTSGGPTNL